MLELTEPSLMDESRHGCFLDRFKKELKDLGLPVNGGNPTLLSGSGSSSNVLQLKQRKHFDWYAESSRQSYEAYQNTPFWKALDELIFARWNPQLQAGAWCLDIGCADGRSTFQMARAGTTLVGFDISRRMIEHAIERARSLDLERFTTFFVADGSRLPIRDKSFDYVIIYGVLHHLPDPRNTCRDTFRVLKNGGLYFGCENNVSVFRGLFDLMMRLRPLWTEEAGPQPLISSAMVRDWLKGLSVDLRFSTRVFVPPHLVNLLGMRLGRAFLTATDRMFSCFPILGNQGGLLVFEARKGP